MIDFTTGDFAQHMTDRIVRELSGTFPHCEKRVRIWADTDKYRWKEDEDIWKQKRGIDSKQYEAYFDGEFICFMDEGRGEQEGWKQFIEKFRELYTLQKIFVHEEMYELRNALEKQRREESITDTIPEARTPEEKIVAEVLIRHAKKKRRKIRRST